MTDIDSPQASTWLNRSRRSADAGADAMHKCADGGERRDIDQVAADQDR